ncbi:MAG: biotin--[acetyl-CoA-carboxylase] ligase [Actinomycetota bacterium]
MDTRNATPNEENLPGQDFRDRKGRGFAEIIAASGHSVRLVDRWLVRRIESTGSTNDDLDRAAQSGAPDRLVLVADHQTAGRGRLDRKWEAPAGANLLVSILFRTVPDRPHRLTQAVALAAVRACRAVTTNSPHEIDVSLKWPNDIVIGSRKLAGILASASTSRLTRIVDDVEVGIPEHVVVGLGLNVGWAPDGAARLGEFRSDIHRDDVLVELLAALDDIFDSCVTVRESDEFHESYRRNLSTLGRAVRVELPSGSVLEGRALGVGVDGRLEVLDACAVTHHIDVADIVHLRFPDSPVS